MSSPPTTTSLGTSSTTKKRRGTIDKGHISRPKLLPLGSGYGLVEGADDSFIAGRGSAGVQLTTFDPRSRGHKRSQTAPNAGSLTTDCDIRRSNTLFGRLRASKDAARALGRRQKNTDTTNEPIEDDQRTRDLTLRIPAITFDKPLPKTPLLSPDGRGENELEYTDDELSQTNVLSESLQGRFFINALVGGPEDTSETETGGILDVPVSAVAEDEGWERPITTFEEDKYGRTRLSHEDHPEALILEHTSPMSHHARHLSIPSSPALYSRGCSLGEISTEAIEIDTVMRMDAISSDSLPFIFVDASVEELEERKVELSDEMKSPAAQADTADRSSFNVDELNFKLFVEYSVDGGSKPGYDGEEMDAVQMALKVMAEGAGEQSDEFFQNADEETVDPSTSRPRDSSTSPLRDLTKATFAPAPRTRKDTDISLFRDHAFVVRRQVKEMTEEDEKRISRRRNGVTLMSPRDLERLESETSTPDDSFSLDQSLIPVAESEEVDVAQVKSNVGPRKPQPGWI